MGILEVWGRLWFIGMAVIASVIVIVLAYCLMVIVIQWAIDKISRCNGERKRYMDYLRNRKAYRCWKERYYG